MSKLEQLAGLAKPVKFGDIEVDVPGISAIDIIGLIVEFKEIAAVLQGPMRPAFTPAMIMDLGKPVVGAFIAAGCGEGDLEGSEEKAANLPAGIQIKLIKTILERTMPEGLDPFLQEVEELMAVLDPDLLAKVKAAFAEPLAQAGSAAPVETPSPSPSTS